LKRDTFFLAGIRTRKEKVSAFGEKTLGSYRYVTKQLFHFLAFYDRVLQLNALKTRKYGTARKTREKKKGHGG
jgi:hypothetical protein